MSSDNHERRLSASDRGDVASQHKRLEGDPLPDPTPREVCRPVQDGCQGAEMGVISTAGQPVAPAQQYRRSLFRH
jgi:hypothetical protein